MNRIEAAVFWALMALAGVALLIGIIGIVADDGEYCKPNERLVLIGKGTPYCMER